MKTSPERWACDEIQTVPSGGPFSDYQRIRRGDQWAVVYKERQICDFVWDEVRSFGGWKNVKVKKNGLFGVMDGSGTLLLDCVWESISTLSYRYGEPYCLLVKKDGLVGVMRVDGTVLLPCVYDKISEQSFSDWDGKENENDWLEINAFVRKDGLWGVLRRADLTDDPGPEGPLAFEPQWERCEHMRTGYTREETNDWTAFTYFIRVRKDGKWGAVDTSGRIITPCQWDEIDKFGNVCLGDQWGFVNLINGEVTAPQWPENQHLCPYRTHRAYETKEEDRWPEPSLWRTTMRIFLADKQEDA